MLDLLEASRTGVLGDFFAEPPSAFDPKNGVIGAGLSHDPLLVADVAHEVELNLGILPHTVEFSAAVASVLAHITRQETLGRSEPSPILDTSAIIARWRDLSYRRFRRSISPFRIELTVTHDFPRSVRTSDDRYEFFRDYRLIYRRAQESRTHFAEPGGRIIPHRPGLAGSRRWGTLGGFLANYRGRALFAVTASHLVEDHAHVTGTPAFAAANLFGARRLLQRTGIAGLLSKSWRAEAGRVAYRSPPPIASPDQCSARSLRFSDDLDVALLEWPFTELRRRKVTSVVGLAEVSQTLQACFVGARSGFVRVRIASLSIWHAYKLTASPQPTVCIGDSLQIALPERPHVHTDVSRRGDSGAWLMADSLEGPRWLGVLVGGDGARSGIVQAERIVNHFENQIGPLTSLI